MSIRMLTPSPLFSLGLPPINTRHPYGLPRRILSARQNGYMTPKAKLALPGWQVLQDGFLE